MYWRHTDTIPGLVLLLCEERWQAVRRACCMLGQLPKCWFSSVVQRLMRPDRKDENSCIPYLHPERAYICVSFVGHGPVSFSSTLRGVAALTNLKNRNPVHTSCHHESASHHPFEHYRLRTLPRRKTCHDPYSVQRPLHAFARIRLVCDVIRIGAPVLSWTQMGPPSHWFRVPVVCCPLFVTVGEVSDTESRKTTARLQDRCQERQKT